MILCVEDQGERCRILSDQGGLLALFADRKMGLVSTSQTDILRQSGGCYTLNREALCEQLISGAIAGRATLFEEIERVDGIGRLQLGSERFDFERAGSAGLVSIPSFRDREHCLDFQVRVLRRYFKKIRDIVGSGAVSLGLSGGYDSRLILALALDAGINVSLFSFNSPAHREECEIAGKLAEISGKELRRVPLRAMGSLSAELFYENSEDALKFFDGRTNESMGSFGDVHTARVFRECVGNAVLNLNGLGGELFRNRERIPRYRSSLRTWLRHYVIGAYGRSVFRDKEGYRAFEDRLALKYSVHLDGSERCWVDRNYVRRWYRELWLPFFAGPRFSAENRVIPSLMPFADSFVSAAALAATPFIGAHGGFEAELIRRINPDLAAVTSSYGHPFTEVPVGRYLKDLVVSAFPLSFRHVRHRFLRKHEVAGKDVFSSVCFSFRDALDYLKNLSLPLDIDRMLQVSGYRDRVLFIAQYLFKHRAKINVAGCCGKS